MSTISASTTTTTAYKVTADTTGKLVLQTGSGPTDAVTIDTSQNVGIGTSSPSSLLHLNGSSPNVRVQDTGANAVRAYLTSTNSAIYLTTDYSSSGVPIVFAQGGVGSGATERMRIDSSGNLLVGATSQIDSEKVGITFDGNSLNGIVFKTTFASTGSNFLRFKNSSNTLAGNIVQNGTTTVAYNTSSDYRLKENIQPMQNALGVVQQLKPCTYTWKEDGSVGQGFIAHELQAVVPDCVTGEKDAVDADGNPDYQGIDTSFLVATLTAAIQEQQALIQTLTQRIETLEAK